MEKMSSWEANIYSATLGICLYKTQEVHYCVCNSFPLDPILNHVSTHPQTQPLKEILHAFLICPMRATYPIHTILLDLIITIIFGEKCMKLLIMQFSPTSCYLLSLRFKYSPQHIVLKHPKSVLCAEIPDKIACSIFDLYICR
jgi:hypothetical protein